jgi:hypothetical protein
MDVSSPSRVIISQQSSFQSLRLYAFGLGATAERNFCAVKGDPNWDMPKNDSHVEKYVMKCGI